MFVSLLLSLVLIMIEHRLLWSASSQVGESIALELRRTPAYDIFAEITARTKSHPSATSFPSIILSLVTLYFVAPREHALVADNQSLGRTITTASAAFAFLYVTLAPLCTPAGARERTLFYTALALLAFALAYLAFRILLIEVSKSEALRLLLNLKRTNRFGSRRSTDKNDERGSTPTISGAPAGRRAGPLSGPGRHSALAPHTGQ